MSFWGKALEIVTGGLGAKIGDVLDQAVTDKDLRQQLKHDLSIAQLMSGAEIEKARLDMEREVQVAIEQTHQAEMAQTDLYTKRTRPKIARQSWALGIGYALITNLVPIITQVIPSLNAVELPAFDPAAFGTMVGPAVWYMGMRGFDKWKGNS